MIDLGSRLSICIDQQSDPSFPVSSCNDLTPVFAPSTKSIWLHVGIEMLKQDVEGRAAEPAVVSSIHTCDLCDNKIINRAGWSSRGLYMNVRLVSIERHDIMLPLICPPIFSNRIGNVIAIIGTIRCNTVWPAVCLRSPDATVSASVASESVRCIV